MHNPQVNSKGVALAIGATLLVALFLLALTNDSPLQAMGYFFSGPFQNTYAFGNFINSIFLLSLTGLGISVAFKGGLFNIGGEGQVYAGALSAALLASALDKWPGFLGIPLVLLAAVIAGAIIGGLSGILKSLWQIDEMISSFLISAMLVPLLDYLIGIPFRNPSGYLIGTPAIPEQFRLWKVLGASNLNGGFFLILFLLAGGWFFFRKTIYGYELRMLGANRKFAYYGGIRVGRYSALAMAASGGLHALAGGLMVAGSKYAAVQGMTSGLGWNGIAVALIAGSNPLYLLPAAAIFAFIEAGTKSVMTYSNFNFEFTAIIQATVFFLVTASKIGGLRRKK